MIPPLIFSLAFEVEVEGGVSDLVAIRDELMVATKAGKILRYSWEGQEIRDYSLDLRRIPFCVDQQVGAILDLWLKVLIFLRLPSFLVQVFGIEIFP